MENIEMMPQHKKIGRNRKLDIKQVPKVINSMNRTVIIQLYKTKISSSIADALFAVEALIPKQIKNHRLKMVILVNNNLFS